MSHFPRIVRRIAAGLVIVMAVAGCRQSPPSSAQAPAAPTAPAFVSHFDGNEAYSFLLAQCAFGIRKPDTAGHEKCRAYIIQQVRPYVDDLQIQPFTFYDPDRDVTLHLTNIIGVINPQAKNKILLFTHWDTRPTSDMEVQDSLKKLPIMGADDGASGTAVLMELAKTLHQYRPDVGVILLFEDGEDWGPNDNHMYLGARYYAAHLPADRPEYAILLDMIGDSNLQIFREVTSEKLHPELNDKVWNAADAIGDGAYFPNVQKWDITDDHDALNDAGIPAIDLIDFDYPYWHTQQDTPDKCSAHSLQVVGDVMVKVLSEEK